MMRLSQQWLLLTLALITAGSSLQIHAADGKALGAGELPADGRLGPLKDLNGYFPFNVPDSKDAWQRRAGDLRRRILVSTGLWPMPEKTPLKANIYGRTERDGFTVEKVHFESVPGHFVTGLLFRPAEGEGPFPAVLSPHGHGGRLQNYSVDQVQKLIEAGQEKYEESGRYPKLARCATLARMGCVVFIFDMLGYADSVQITQTVAHRFKNPRPELDTPDRWGFFSTQAELRMQSIMGLQTWNSVRALDFLAELPDVDAKRMAVTGGSGGGTQTILLGAIDSRPVASFPQGMVSTSMQGGCTCENATLLRIGTGNVELAGLFAPRPMAMTGANDWTKEIATKGYPQLQELYAMLGQPDNVYSISFLEFPHNYNYVTRRIMYGWMNKHLGLGHEEPIIERDYKLLTADEYTIWDEEHPAPKGGDEYEASLTKQMARASQAQLKAISDDSQKLREVLGGAYDTIINPLNFKPDAITRIKKIKANEGGYLLFADLLKNSANDSEIPVLSIYPKAATWNQKVVIWVDGQGKKGLLNDQGRLIAGAQGLVDAGYSIVSVDAFGQGEFLNPGENSRQARIINNGREFAGYTYGYNDTMFSRRVHDIQTAVSWVVNDEHAPIEVSIVGVNGGAPLAAAAANVIDEVDRVALDTRGFRFTTLKSYRDPQFLPGAAKYGDLPGLISQLAPRPLGLIGEGRELPKLVQSMYAGSGQPDVANPIVIEDTDTSLALANWLMGLQ